MSNTNINGGPAVEVPLVNGGVALVSPCDGMTLRDYFAGKALQGICAHPDTWGLLQKGIARTAYDMADAMLEARGD